jgi:hypothetical membrane protein
VKRTGHRLRALGGVAGPIAFIGAWSILGAAKQGYSPVSEPVSRLAAKASPQRYAMTAGFVAFGLGVAQYARELRTVVPGGSAAAATTSAVATLGIALTPLGGRLGGRPHQACAAVAYLGLTATPILAGRQLRGRGRRQAAVISTSIGIASGVFLLASAAPSGKVGLWQRLGLTLGDAWIVISAIWLTRGARSCHRPTAG